MLTTEQLEQRKNYITGSDASGICGMSKWRTPVQIWLEKTNRMEAEDISHLDHIKFGNYMEDGVADWFVAETGKKLKPKSNTMIVHPEHKWMSGNLDFEIDGENAILECKTALRDTEWGEGSDDIPREYLLQVAHYCAVGNFDRAYIAVVFVMKRQMRVYTYERNVDLEVKLIAKEQAFWNNHIVADVQPEPTTEKDIDTLFSVPATTASYASVEQEELVKQYAQLKASIKASEDKMELVRDSICAYMKDSELLLTTSGESLIRWKFKKGSRLFDKARFTEENPELAAKYIKIGAAGRNFSVTMKGKGDS